MSLRDQFLVFQRLSADQLHESVPEQVWVVAVVEALEFEAEAKSLGKLAPESVGG